MSLLKVNEVQNYNGSSLTLTASTVSTSAQLNTGGNISVTGSINVSDDSTTRSNLGLGSIATQDSDNVTVTGGTATLGALTVSGSDSGDLVRITQTGSGNALVVEDSANPDSTPFVVSAFGNVGIGTNSPNYLLEAASAGTSAIAITAASTSYDSEIHFIHGTTVDGGITYDHNGSYSAEAMKFRTGNNTTNMTLTGTGNLTITGSYSPFTATHIASIQNPENYKYGEIIEIESIVSNGFNIHYNARLANSDPRKILGIFREVIQDFDENGNLIHNSLVNVLGDGHILVNSENGNIKTGDAITLSSTAGVGKKAAEPCYVIGIAQEDFIFEIESEPVLIPVQYGLQYFIPENFIESQQSQIDALTARIEALETA